MPTQGYEVVVGVTGHTDEQNAIADASQYLGYADQTDTFGYRADVTDVKVISDADGPTAVSLHFVVQETENQLDRFENELDILARVESFDRLRYVVQ